MFTYQPYTYYIAWTGINLQYYGVRYASDCHPDDFWTTYFTSSKVVATLREEFGDPDVIQIRKIFDCREKAIDWEHKVLRRLKVITNESWANQAVTWPCPPKFDDAHRKALSKARKGKVKFSDETKAKLSAIRKKEWEDPILRKKRSNPQSDEAKEKIAEYQRGQTRTDEHKAQIVAMRKAEWADEEKTAARKKAISDAIKAKWADPEYRARMMNRKKKS